MSWHRLIAGLVIAFAFCMFGWNGTATADDDLVGLRYSEAKSLLAEQGLAAVVGTVTGDRAPHDRCFVVSTSTKTPMDSSGVAGSAVMQLNLSCYSKPASSKQPGFSAGNNGEDATAVRVTSAQEAKEWKATKEGQKWCAATTKQHPEWGAIPDCMPAER